MASSSRARNDAADFALDLGELLGGVLDAGADGRARMQGDLAGIHGGKEIRAQERHQQRRTPAPRPGSRRRTAAAAIMRQRQKVAIALARVGEAALEAASAAAPGHGCLRPMHGVSAASAHARMMRLEQIQRQGRHQGARQDEGGDHGEHHAHRHGHEEKARHALQREHRHEDDADAEQRDKGRLHDLARAVHDGGAHILAMLQVPVDVLDGDGGVVHQDAHRQRQPAQGHDVEGLAGRPQRRSAPHSTASGMEVAMMTVERQLPRNNRIIRLVRAAAMAPSRTTPVMAAFTKIDWSVSRSILSESGSWALEQRQHVLDALHHVEGRGRAVLQHGGEHGAAAIDMHDIVLRRVAVAHMGRHRA